MAELKFLLLRNNLCEEHFVLTSLLLKYSLPYFLSSFFEKVQELKIRKIRIRYFIIQKSLGLTHGQGVDSIFVAAPVFSPNIKLFIRPKSGKPPIKTPPCSKSIISES